MFLYDFYRVNKEEGLKSPGQGCEMALTCQVKCLKLSRT